MLEIIILIFLCRSNYKRAKTRGKSGGGAIAYTLGLWFAFEIIGIIFALSFFTIDLYYYTNLGILLLFSLGFAGIGGFISYLISKRGEVSYLHVEPHSLKSPCTLRIYRDSSETNKFTKLYFYLNGEILDSLEDDSMLIAKATQSHNTVAARFENEQKLTDSYQFTASANNVIEIHCVAGKFLPNSTKVIEGPERDW